MGKAIFILPLVLILSLEIMAQSSNSPSPRSKLKIGYVTGWDVGCGCYFYLNEADRRKVLPVCLVDMCGRRQPCVNTERIGYIKINIDGKNLELRLVDFSDAQDASKVGARLWATYAAGDVKARIDWTVTHDRTPENDLRKVTRYKAVMTITRNSQTAIVKTVGDCGC